MCNLKAPKLGTGHQWDFQLKKGHVQTCTFSLQKFKNPHKKRTKPKKSGTAVFLTSKIGTLESSLAISRPFTNHSTGCITSPVRGRKGLPPYSLSLQWNAIYTPTNRIFYVYAINLWASFFIAQWLAITGRQTHKYIFSTGKLEDLSIHTPAKWQPWLLKFLYSLHPPQDLYGHSLRAP